MELTKENIERKIEELEKGKQTAIGQINAISGAIQALKDLLKEEPKNETV